MPAEGWYFGAVGRDEITLKGGGAVYSKSRRGAGDGLVIELTLEPLNRYMDSLSGLRLEKDGAAYWNPVSNAGSYELRVYRDGRVFGDAVTVRSERYSCWEKLITPVWRQAADGRWWYDWGDGTWPADCWEEIQGKWYFFDPEGYMKTGWFLWEDQWYYCTEKGYMLSDCITEDGYWLGADGALIWQ